MLKEPVGYYYTTFSSGLERIGTYTGAFQIFGEFWQGGTLAPLVASTLRPQTETVLLRSQ